MSTSYLTDHLTALQEADVDDGVPQSVDVWKRTLPAGRYEIEAETSQVEFVTRTLGVVPVSGTFEQVSGHVDVHDPVEGSQARIEVAAASIDTGVALRDTQVRSTPFLAADDHPLLVFDAEHVQPLGRDTFAVHGQLTIKQTTQPAVFHVTITDAHKDAGDWLATFVGTAEIDRRAFAVPSTELFALWGLAVAPETTVRLTIRARMAS